MQTLVLTGSPYQIGKEHGVAFAKEIREFAASRLKLLQGYLPNWSLDDIYELAREHIDVLQEYREEFEEFCGIADGADLPQEDLMILNNYTDMRNFSKTDDGCSVLYYNGPSGAVYGQTWDMTADAAPFIIHLHIKNTPELHLFTVVGCMALCGVNQFGVGVFINDLKTKKTGRGLMWPALVRRILLKKTAKEGLEFISRNLPASSHHYLIVDGNEAYSVETTGKDTEVVKSVKGQGYAFHTNHFIGTLDKTIPDPTIVSTTYDRYDGLQRFFERHNTLNYQQIADGLFGSSIANGGVCLYGNNGKATAITCGGLLYDFKNRQGEVFEADYCTKNAKLFQF